MTTKSDEISKKTVEVLSKAYARRLVPDETGGYIASIQEFPGCFAEGDTAESAINKLYDVATSWVEVALSNGYEIREPVSFFGCSGKIALRIPRGLHKQVAELAELEDSSINQLLVTAIAQYIGNKQAFGQASEMVLSEIRKVMTDGIVSFYRNNPWTLSIILPMPRNHLYNRGDTIEGKVVAEKIFNLGGTSGSLKNAPI